MRSSRSRKVPALIGKDNQLMYCRFIGVIKHLTNQRNPSRSNSLYKVPVPIVSVLHMSRTDFFVPFDCLQRLVSLFTAV